MSHLNFMIMGQKSLRLGMGSDQTMRLNSHSGTQLMITICSILIEKWWRLNFIFQKEDQLNWLELDSSYFKIFWEKIVLDLWNQSFISWAINCQIFRLDWFIIKWDFEIQFQLQLNGTRKSHYNKNQLSLKPDWLRFESERSETCSYHTAVLKMHAHSVFTSSLTKKSILQRTLLVRTQLLMTQKSMKFPTQIN